MDRTHINNKLLVGWSVLAAPPTGRIVQHAEQPYYQAGPGMALQGPLAASVVFVAHTQDLQPLAGIGRELLTTSHGTVIAEPGAVVNPTAGQPAPVGPAGVSRRRRCSDQGATTTSKGSEGEEQSVWS